MKNIIIGTAGHIDHGKTSLIKALTGRDTDRWEEEKRRGITIDLGFTYFDLPNGDRAGIIDVPGHEKFINNMVAGVVGMDMVLLVVAADEGIMPQTREHIDILGLLGVEKSIVVLNKCDLVEEEWLELVEEELREELKGSFLENAPMIRVSSATKFGISELIEEIIKLESENGFEKDLEGIPRLPVDRAFSISGFGTVVTGTLISGILEKEEMLEVYPSGKECKIRSIQVHGQDTTKCVAGQRVAINISNLKKKEIQRGCVLARKDSMQNTDLLDVKMKILPSSNRVLTNHSRLHLFTGTGEVLCRAVLLDQEEIAPGESGYVQLRLEEAIAVRRGDRFVVRFYSPMETIGGGVILEPNPVKKRRFQEETIEELRRKEEGNSADILEIHIRKYGDTMVSVVELGKLTGQSVQQLEMDLRELEQREKVVKFSMQKEAFVWHKEHYFEKKKWIEERLTSYGKEYPYRYGMKKSELQGLAFRKMKPSLFDRVIESLESEQVLARREEYLALPSFEIQKDEIFQRVIAYYRTCFEKAGYDFLRYSEISLPKGVEEALRDDIFNVLLTEEEVVKVGENIYTLKSLMEAAKEAIQNTLKEKGIITIAEVRDLFQTSRKSAKPILEYMDGIKVTKKAGAETERIAYQ